MPLTTVPDLVARFERDPESDVLAAMLTDALMEEMGLLRFEADAQVEKVRKSARDVLDMTFAAELVAAHGPAYVRLLVHLAGQEVALQEGGFTLIVAPIEADYVWTQDHEMTTGGNYWERITVTLGAAWVRRWWAAAGRPAIHDAKRKHPRAARRPVTSRARPDECPPSPRT